MIVAIAALSAVRLRPPSTQRRPAAEPPVPQVLSVDPSQVVSDAPTVVVFSIVIFLILELAILAAIIYMRWQEKRRYRFAPEDPFEEREIVVPPPAPPAERTGPPAASAHRPRIRRRLLQRARGAGEGRPLAATLHGDLAGHADRAAPEGLPGTALSRLGRRLPAVRYGDRRGSGTGGSAAAAGDWRACATSCAAPPRAVAPRVALLTTPLADLRVIGTWSKSPTMQGR